MHNPIIKVQVFVRPIADDDGGGGLLLFLSFSILIDIIYTSIYRSLRSAPLKSTEMMK
jgi:hypothetical protein